MVYCYVMEATSTHPSGIFGLGSQHTAADWANYAKDISALYLAVTNNGKIGGIGQIVEIDETQIFKNKNHQGRITVEQRRMHGCLEGSVERQKNILCACTRQN